MLDWSCQPCHTVYPRPPFPLSQDGFGNYKLFFFSPKIVQYFSALNIKLPRFIFGISDVIKSFSIFISYRLLHHAYISPTVPFVSVQQNNARCELHQKIENLLPICAICDENIATGHCI